MGPVAVSSGFAVVRFGSVRFGCGWVRFGPVRLGPWFASVGSGSGSCRGLVSVLLGFWLPGGAWPWFSLVRFFCFLVGLWSLFCVAFVCLPVGAPCRLSCCSRLRWLFPPAPGFVFNGAARHTLQQVSRRLEFYRCCRVFCSERRVFYNMRPCSPLAVFFSLRGPRENQCDRCPPQVFGRMRPFC